MERSWFCWWCPRFIFASGSGEMLLSIVRGGLFIKNIWIAIRNHLNLRYFCDWLMEEIQDVKGREQTLPSPVISGFATVSAEGRVLTADTTFVEFLRLIAPDISLDSDIIRFLKDHATEVLSLPEESQSHIGTNPVYRWIIRDPSSEKVNRVIDFTVAQVRGKDQNYHVSLTDISSQWKNEQVLKLMIEITNAIQVSRDLEELIRSIRNGLSRIMDTSNFFVAIYDKNSGQLSFPFFADAKDHFETVPAKNTLTGYVIETGKAQLLSGKEMNRLASEGRVKLVGTNSKVWMGAPLRSEGEVFGVISLQSYEDEHAFSESDREILDLLASQVGLAIDRKRKQDVIQTGRNYFETLFQNAPVPIVIQKSPGIITDVNEAFEHLFGYQAEEVIGRSIDEIIVPDELADEGREITKKAFAGEHIEKEVIRRKADGQLVELALKANVFQIAPGEKVVYAMYQDISQKKEFERKLVEAKEKAEEADRLKSAFLTNMSHEIRTPMNAILGFSQLLAGADLNPEQKSEYIRIILDSGESLMLLIDDILDLAKIESGQMDIRKESVDVEDLLSSLQATFLELIEKKLHKDLEIKLVIPRTHDPVTIYTDPLRLKQILTNLIGNAVKFTSEGKIEIGYTLPDEAHKVVSFFVRDTGIGIPENKLQAIFNRFQQVDNSRTRQYAGTGLGLAISKKLTRLLGGDITVKSTVGQGSEFSFTIPYEVSEEESGLRQVSENKDEYPDLSPYKIMIAEDDVINFMFMRELLKKTGAKLVRANNGREVLQYFDKDPGIDLVLMDMEMPEMNGYEATRTLRKQFPDIPIIAQTAYASPEEKKNCLDAGCNDYIAKPIQMQKLYKLIRQYLRTETQE